MTHSGCAIHVDVAVDVKVDVDVDGNVPAVGKITTGGAEAAVAVCFVPAAVALVVADAVAVAVVDDAVVVAVAVAASAASTAAVSADAVAEERSCGGSMDVRGLLINRVRMAQEMRTNL
jgi:hypothetical protein